MKNFWQRYRNARKAIQQIRAGEWVPKYNPLSKEHLTANRGDLELWIGNGAFFCEIKGGLYFGLLWRHWVWLAAAGPMKLNAYRDQHPETMPVL